MTQHYGEYMICAEGDDRDNICQGDSGGPLIVWSNNNNNNNNDDEAVQSRGRIMGYRLRIRSSWGLFTHI